MATAAPASPFEAPPDSAAYAEMPIDSSESLVFWFRLVAGGERYAVDPYRVGRVLAQHLQGRSVWETIRLAKDDESPLAVQAMETLLGACSQAFGIRLMGIDGNGVTEATLIRVLTQFMDFQEQCKHFFGPVRIWRSPPDPSAPSDEPPPLSNAGASTSISGADTGNSPPQSTPA